MSSNIPTLSDIIQSSPAQATIAESPVAPGSRRFSQRFNAQQEAVDDDETLMTLSTRRDELINKRKNLQRMISDIQLEILTFKEDGSTATDEVLKIPSHSNKNKELNKLRRELNKLPIIENWDLRLELLKLFQPHVQIEINSIQVTNSLKDVQFELKYHKLFKIAIIFKIDILDEKVVKWQIRYDNIPTELSQAIENFKDITFVVFSINSYVRLLLNKIDVWLKIFDKYHDRLTINELDSSNELINFLKLKNEPILRVKSVDKELNIIWDLQADEFGEFQTTIRCLLIQKDKDLMKNYDELITEMIKNDGLLQGICLIIENALLSSIE